MISIGKTMFFIEKVCCRSTAGKKVQIARMFTRRGAHRIEPVVRIHTDEHLEAVHSEARNKAPAWGRRTLGLGMPQAALGLECWDRIRVLNHVRQKLLPKGDPQSCSEKRP